MRLVPPMKLRPINVSRRKQLDDHKHIVLNRVEGEHPKLLSMGFVPDRVPDVPERLEFGSLQGVRAFRPAGTFGDTLHPDAREFFDAEELAAPQAEPRQVPVLNRLAYQHIDCVPDSEHGALVGFQTEAQEKADIEHNKKLHDRAEKRKRRAIRAGYKVATDLVTIDPAAAEKAAAEREKWANIRRETAAETSDRLRYGFFTHSCKVAGEVVEKFAEFLGEGILRSGLGSPSLARMAALYPKVESLRAGYDKTALLTTTSKLFALDCPYVELNKKVAGCIVVELDVVLRVEEFRNALLEILGPHRMPNLMVGRISASGFLVRPHLLWILRTPVWNEPYRESADPLTGEVSTSGDPRCKTKPIAKVGFIQRGLTQLLLPLGADPACRNVWKPKNPLSPFWTTIITNDDCWHDLGDFDQIKGWPRNVDEAAMAETAAKMRAEATGASPSASNLAWNTVSQVIQPMARKALATQQADFVAAGKSIETLAAWFDAQVRPVVEAQIGQSAGLDRILGRQCAFAARWCLGKVSRRRKTKARGRDRDLITEGKTVEERCEAAGTRTAEHTHGVAMWKLCQELAVAMMAGSVDKTAFIKRIALVSPSMAYDRWDEACASLGIEFRDGAHRYIAKPTTGPSEKLSTSSEQVRAIVYGPSAVDSTSSAPAVPGHPVRTDDPPLRDPVTRCEAAGPPDPPWSTCASPPADVRQHADSCVLDPA